MELSKIFGLPAHPLLVHIPVVLVPLAALGTVLMVVSARVRARIGWMVAGAAVVGAGGALLAASAGETLQATLAQSSAIEHHAELGDAAKALSAVFALAVVAYVVIEWWSARRARTNFAGSVGAAAVAPSKLRRWAVPLAATASIVTGALATAWIVQAGHTGAKAAWHDVAGGPSGGASGG